MIGTHHEKSQSLPNWFVLSSHLESLGSSGWTVTDLIQGMNCGMTTRCFGYTSRSTAVFGSQGNVPLLLPPIRPLHACWAYTRAGAAVQRATFGIDSLSSQSRHALSRGTGTSASALRSPARRTHLSGQPSMFYAQCPNSDAVHALQQSRLGHMQVGTISENVTYFPAIERRIVVIRCKS